ncbi:MAG: sialate O-acetylesterase [Candidatus Latescibacteria bacterium]|nr:sialate O-acetylesterase [Candidatus Latescibacterota bacterium]
MDKRHIFSLYTTLFLLLCTGISNLHADVRLPAIIGHHMVIQRDQKIPVWGWANPGERVTVEFNGQRKSTSATSNGRWIVELAPLKAGGPYEMTIQGNNTIILYNILAGDVWVCSGQSNMEWPVKYSANPDKEILDGNHPKMRLFEVKKDGAGEPQEDLSGQWQECTPHTVGDITGVGYYFGRKLMRELDVPIGVLQSAWGGTAIKQWVSRETFESNPKISHVLDGYEQVLDGKPDEIDKYYETLSGWFEYCFVQMSRRESYGPIPQPAKGFEKVGGAPTLLYNAMIAPLTRFPVKGFTWYQGESDSGSAYLYRDMLPALIRDWRMHWGQQDLPFMIVQLANWGKRTDLPGENAQAELREAQLKTWQDVAGTAMAVTIDIGTEDVHYKNKQDAGERLALGALKVAYGRNIVSSGPIYKSMTVRDGKIYLMFDFIGSGLSTPNGEPLKGFAIAGSDRNFVWAQAQIEGKNIKVWSDSVPNPASVRYAWGMNPECNLYNKEGLPASPFRTDDWPGVTADKK